MGFETGVNAYAVGPAGDFFVFPNLVQICVAFKPISKGAYCKWPYIGFRIRCMPNKAKELSRLGIAHPELAKNQPARKKDEGSFRVLQRLSNVAGFDR